RRRPQLRRLLFPVRKREGTLVAKRRDTLPRLGRLDRIDLCENDFWSLPARFREHFAPWRDNDRISEGFAPVSMAAGLRRGNNEGAVLDRARPLQDVPVRLAGLAREGCGRGQRRRPRVSLRPIEMRKADVVADGDAELKPQQIGDDGPIAGAVDRGLAPAL